MYTNISNYRKDLLKIQWKDQNVYLYRSLTTNGDYKTRSCSLLVDEWMARTIHVTIMVHSALYSYRLQTLHT
jgi:hypothetical protein